MKTRTGSPKKKKQEQVPPQNKTPEEQAVQKKKKKLITGSPQIADLTSPGCRLQIATSKVSQVC